MIRNRIKCGTASMANSHALEEYGQDYLDHILTSMARDLADHVITQITDGEKIVTLSQVEANEHYCGEYWTQYKQYISFEELVRCADCKHNPMISGNCPMMRWYGYNPKGFCYLGEKDDDVSTDNSNDSNSGGSICQAEGNTDTEERR